ncbi:hypothetical protein JTB14_023844 [Gonioctena quinquepunctata]|nr:hypothetical protein JTB14_023844 [Gonioctena quinquepunctata]
MVILIIALTLLVTCSNHQSSDLVNKTAYDRFRQEVGFGVPVFILVEKPPFSCAVHFVQQVAAKQFPAWAFDGALSIDGTPKISTSQSRDIDDIETQDKVIVKQLDRLGQELTDFRTEVASDLTGLKNENEELGAIDNKLQRRLERPEEKYNLVVHGIQKDGIDTHIALLSMFKNKFEEEIYDFGIRVAYRIDEVFKDLDPLLALNTSISFESPANLFLQLSFSSTSGTIASETHGII